MTRTWRNAPSMQPGLGSRLLGERCPACGAPLLPDGRCVVSGHAGWCEAGIKDGERWDWTPQPDGNRAAQERVREARRAYSEAVKEPNP